MQRVRIGVLTYGGILALVLVYGSVRMAFFPPQSATLQVASLIQTTDYLSFLRMEGLLASQDRFPELGERLLQQSRQQAQAGADVIIWQEAGRTSATER